MDRKEGSIVRLEELAEIISARGIPSWQWVEEGIPYIRSRDLIDGHLATARVNISEESARSLPRQLLQEGDILLSRSWGQHKIAQVQLKDLPAFASDALFIIRPFSVSPKYLYDYFSSKTGYAVLKRQLDSIQRGIHIPLSALKDLKVPLFSSEEMVEITQIKQLDSERVLSLLKKMLSYASGQELEAKAYQDFLKRGWSPNELRVENKINGYLSDLSLFDGDTLLAVVEFKISLNSRNREWLNRLTSMLTPLEACLILSTGYYYEIHVLGTGITVKQLECPSKTQLLELVGNREGGING